MENTTQYHRPPFEDAHDAWKSLLQARGHSTDVTWVLEENLCFERDTGVHGGVKLSFQTKFTPHPEGAAKTIYHHFAETNSRIVFYRLGGNGGRSICMLLCDPWFEPKNEREGYVRHDQWGISFHPGQPNEIEEINDPTRWRQRIVRGRPLTALDFCMTVSALEELKAHGRVLDADERLGLKILRSMQRD